MTKLMKYLPVALLSGVFCLSTLNAEAEYEGSYPYKAVCTTGMVADIVKNVAGERAAVTNIIGEGVDPHLYTPNRDDVAQLIRADVVFYSGLLLEGRMTSALETVGKRKPVYAVTELIDKSYLLDYPANPGHHDPHVWMDVKGWTSATEAVLESLSEFDPANAVEYKKNYNGFVDELKRLDDYTRKAFESIPADKRVLVTAHDAFSYMARAYGLEVRGIQGISTESEAGLQDINRLVGYIVDKKIPSVFVETSVSDKNVRALIEGAGSKGHKVRIGGSLYSDAMGPAGTYEGTYVGMIDHNVTVITLALGGKAPERGMQGKLTLHLDELRNIAKSKDNSQTSSQ